MRASLRRRLLTAYLVPTTLALGVMAVVSFGLARRALEGSLGDRLVGLAQAAAVDLRPEDMRFLEPGDETGRTYARVRRDLARFRDATGLRRVVVFDPEGRALVDSGGVYPIGTRVADLARDRLEVETALGGRANASAVLFAGEDGRRYKTGYAPVRDGDQVVAGVGVDGSAAFFGPLEALGRSVVGLSLLGLLAVAGVSLVVSRSVTEPLGRLVAAARRIGQGDLETPVPRPGRPEEVDFLAGTLDEMRAELAARERQLQMMLSGIAHEVRNPLGGLELFSGLLAEEVAGDPEKSAHVARIRKELAHLGRLVERFLDYARERPLELETVEPSALLAEVAQLVGPDAAAREVAVAVEGTAAPARADAALVRLALLNLARNAVEATPAGGRVTLEAGDRDGALVLAVSDSGPGVEPGLGARIFEPFFTTRAQGSGLGLALVRKAADAHGGTVALASPQEGGARFELVLPRSRPLLAAGGR